MSFKIDMTGWHMSEHGIPDSKWTIEKYLYGKYWQGRCDCGTVKPVIGADVRNGKSKSCGCLKRENTSKNFLKDITGWKIWEHGVPDSKIIVLNLLDKESNEKERFWNCLCTECGSTFKSTHGRLMSGNTKTCGCASRKATLERNLKLSDIEIGKTYNYLTPIKYLGLKYATENSRKRRSYYLCKCELCGKEVEVTSNALVSGRTKSCGCLHLSYGELRIEQILIENNISFEKQKTFNTCLSNSNKKLRFDFYINNSFLLEFDGEQHFHSSATSKWNTEENLQKTKERDEIKNTWCKNNNIILKRIPYTKLTTLCLEDIMGDNFIYKGDDF